MNELFTEVFVEQTLASPGSAKNANVAKYQLTCQKKSKKIPKLSEYGLYTVLHYTGCIVLHCIH